MWFALTRHEPGGKPPICLFATRRGGSTWLAEVLAANRGVLLLDQPFSANTGTPTPAQARRMPKFDGGIVTDLDGAREEAFRTYADAVLSGAVPVNAPTRFWSRDFGFRTDRLLLKILGANAVIDWIAAHYGVDVVYLTRHPIPQALSCIRNGWSLTAESFLRSPGFVERHLDDATLALARDVLRRGTPLEQYVLNWTLENVVPARVLASRPAWTFVSYERCVLEPLATVEALAAALDLDDVPSMRKKLGQASRSSHLSVDATRARITAGDREYLVGRWREEVGADEERRVMEIPARFGIDLYRPGALSPDPPWRLRATAGT